MSWNWTILIMDNMVVGLILHFTRMSHSAFDNDCAAATDDDDDAQNQNIRVFPNKYLKQKQCAEIEAYCQSSNGARVKMKSGPSTMKNRINMRI